MTDRDRLIELLDATFEKQYKNLVITAPHTADYLIANGVTVNEWRPASEPPKENGQYLCIYRFGGMRMTFTRVLDYYATDPTPHFQHTLGEGNMIVTHWMPLPQPPKEVG